MRSAEEIPVQAKGGNQVAEDDVSYLDQESMEFLRRMVPPQETLRIPGQENVVQHAVRSGGNRVAIIADQIQGEGRRGVEARDVFGTLPVPAECWPPWLWESYRKAGGRAAWRDAKETRPVMTASVAYGVELARHGDTEKTALTYRLLLEVDPRARMGAEAAFGQTWVIATLDAVLGRLP